MFPPKKKPAFPPLKGGKSGDPEAPDPLEADPKPSPFGAKSSPFGAKPSPKPPAASPVDDGTAGAADEGAESPGYESSEQTGATLIKDIESAGTNLGLDAAQSRSFAADVFSSMADCLRRGQGGDAGDSGGPSQFDTGNSGGEYPA